MSTVYGIYGASGFGKEVLPLAKEQFGSKSKIVFVDDGDVPNELLGCDILNFEQFLNLEGQKKVTIAIANSKIREKLTLKCLENSFEIFKTLAPNRVTASQAANYTKYKLYMDDKIKVGYSFILNKLSEKEQDKFIFKYQEQYQDGYIQKK